MDSAGLRLVLEASRDGAALRRRPRPAGGAAHLQPRRPRRRAPDDARSAAGRVRRRAEGAGATLVGIALVFALSYLDAAWDEQNIAATIVIAPFLTAMFAGARQTAAVAVFAIVAGVLSGGYNDNYGTNDYFVRLVVVVAGAAFAVMAAHSRRRLADDRHRFGLLRGAAEIADTVVAIPEVVDRVGALLVPAFADICVIDVLRGGRVERLGVVAHGPDAARIEERLRARGPWTVEAIRAGRPLLVAHVDEPHLRRNARDEEDLEFLRSLRERSHMNVPLRSRGRNVGTLALLATSHPYGESDLRAGDPARRPDRARARQRRPVRRAGGVAAPPHHRAGHAGRGGDDPGGGRQPGLRQRGRGGLARLRDAGGAARHPAARDRRRVRLLPRGRLAAEPRPAARPEGAARRAGGARARARGRPHAAARNAGGWSSRRRCRCARASRGWP